MKEKTKRSLYVTGKLSGKAAKISLAATLGFFFVGWISNFALDITERRELKKKLNKYNNDKKK